MTRNDYALISLAFLFLTTPAGKIIGLLIYQAGKKLISGSQTPAETIAAEATDTHTFPADEGTKRMGLWIGCTERIIILAFVLTNHYDAVGLLIAAKSILRVSDKEARKQTEYVLLGTLLSLAVAVAVGETLKQLIPAFAIPK